MKRTSLPAPRSRKGVPLRLALTLGLLSAALAPAHATGLQEAFEAAQRNDPSLQAARQQVDTSRELRRAARGVLRPSVAAVASAAKGRLHTNMKAPGSYHNQLAGLVLSIPLYLPQERARLSQAEVGERLAFSQLAQSLQQLATQVASSYFAVLQAQDAVAVAEAQGAAIQEQFEAARESYAAGNATITDQQEAQARLDLNRAQLAAARNTLISRQASFAQLTGLPGTHLNPLPGNAPLRPVPPEPQAWWEAQARTRSFLVQQAELGMEAARHGLDAARAAHYPSVGIVSQAATQHGQTNLTVGTPIQRSRDVSAMLQVQVPLYAGGSLQALERAQAATLGQRESQLEAARRGAAQQARDTYLALQSSLQQAEALQAAVRSSQLALESNNTGYQAGVRINVDVLNAQQQLFQARQNLAATRYAVLLNQLRLKAAIGGLSDADIEAVDRQLQVRAGGPGAAPSPGPSSLPAP